MAVKYTRTIFSTNLQYLPWHTHTKSYLNGTFSRQTEYGVCRWFHSVELIRQVLTISVWNGQTKEWSWSLNWRDMDTCFLSKGVKENESSGNLIYHAEVTSHADSLHTVLVSGSNITQRFGFTFSQWLCQTRNWWIHPYVYKTVFFSKVLFC